MPGTNSPSNSNRDVQVEVERGCWYGSFQWLTIDNDKIKRGPAAWRFLSAVRDAGAETGLKMGAVSAATIPDDRYPVPVGLVQAIVRLVGSVPHDDAGHGYPTYRSSDAWQ